MNQKPTVGHELSGTHFAIVLNKNDFPGNGLVTVIPLTSKNKPYYLDLGDFLVSSIRNVINEELSKIQDSIHSEMPLDEMLDQIKTLQSIQKDYNHLSNKSEISYAMPQNIVTISKYKVKKQSEGFNPLRKIRLNNELLDKLDDEIIKYFTNRD